jgi:PAS domain S-box-containing protein
MSPTSNNPAKAASGKTQGSLIRFINSLDEGFELLELILDQQGDVADFVFLEVNPAYEKQTGLKAANLIGKRKKEVAPASEQRWYDYAIQAAKTGKTLHYQYYNSKVNRYFETQFIPISTNQIAVLFKDITDRKKTEEVLRESVEKFKRLFEDSPDSIALVNAEGVVLEANQSLLKLLGTTKEELVGKNFAALTSGFGLDTEQQRIDFGRRIVKGALAAQELTFVNQEGKRKTVSVKSTALKSNGKVTGVIFILQNVTESKKAQEALTASEERYRHLVKYAPTAIYEIDFTGPRFISVNDAMCIMSGYKREELLGLNPFFVLAPESQVLFKQRIGKVLAGKKINEHVEYRVFTKDGRELWVTLNIKLMGKDGRYYGAQVVAHDITELKKLEKQLQDQERLAAIGATAGMVGHDIRNPLQAIAGDLYLIDNDVACLSVGEIKESLQESVKSIQGNLLYIAKIVEDLQDYAKTLKPNIEKIELAKVIEEIMLLVSVDSNHQVIIDVETGFEEFAADFSMLKRALYNLVHNAIQAMPNGGRLTIQARRKDKRGFITVEDTGVGIPEEIKPKLFTPLVTTKSKGQGLGLAVVKRLVEAQRGTITFESQVGKGTKFTIELPLPN